MEDKQITGCVSCNADMSQQTHTETFTRLAHVQTRIPLCDHCLEFPHRMDMDHILNTVRDLKVWWMEESGTHELLKALIRNKTERYKNPKPVIIGLILTELDTKGGVLLAGMRSPKMKEYPNELALLSGYMEEKHGDWRGTLQAEGIEELCVTIQAYSPLVYPCSFESAGKGRLLLNWAVVLPGATTLQPFVPNDEAVARHEIPFTWDERPTFGIHQHNAILWKFCNDMKNKS